MLALLDAKLAAQPWLAAAIPDASAAARPRELRSPEGNEAWSASEDAKLRRAVAAEYTLDQGPPWKKVAAAFGGGRSAKQCKRRYSALREQPVSMTSPD